MSSSFSNILTFYLAIAFGTFHVLAGNWNTNVRPLVTERLDPIVNPNGVASHMHAVVGGSAFAASYNFADSQKSSCTSFPISVDKSNYWMPKLYWINNGTGGEQSFTPLPQGHRVYYFRVKSSPNSTIQAFPEGLRMLAGDPNAKSANTVVNNFICRVDAKFMGPDDVQTDNFNIPRDCPNGLLVQVKFPSCWDGANLYKSDQSHMSYPVSSGALWGSCPWSHPIRLPSIMLEYYFQTSKWAAGQPLAGNLAWANGDTTGFGAHADFTNGWDTKILQKALDDPTCGADVDMTFQECPVFTPFVKDAACSPDKGQMAEPTGPNVDLVPLSALPGCNKLWSSGSKPTCSTPPAQPNVTSFTGTNGALVATVNQSLVLPTLPGWTSLGCIRDASVMLLNSTRYSDANVTQTTCFDSCLRSGYSYAAIGKMWGTTWDCQCGTGVSPDAQSYPGMCNLTCPGNSSQACGGSGAHQTFYAPAKTQTNLPFTTDLGCYNDPPAGNASLEMQASYNFTSWDKMSVGLCLQACADRGLGWGAVRNGATCYCGAKDKFALGKGQWVSSGLCNTKCPGNSTQSCGFWNGANVFNTTTLGYTATVLNKPAGYQSCFSGSNSSLTGPQWYDGALTPQRCQSSCYELGYPLAAVFNTNMCLCGDKYQGGGTLPVAMCNGKCPGNSTTPITCGAQWNIGELYETSAVAATVNATAATRPAGWQGCYANGDTLLPDYYVADGKMTVEKCLSSCDELGYPFAGVLNQNQCRCSKTGPSASTAKIASNVYCNLPCSGNPAETCGGWGRAEVYKINPTKVPGGETARPGYKGCFNGTTGLTAYSWTDWSKMTIEGCTKGCRELGYSLSSVRQATCSCGNSWTGGPQLSSLSCALNCTGDATERCGGWPSMSSVYSSSAGAAVSFPSQYKGCYNDSLSTKILTGYSTWLSSDASSVTACRSICAAKNFAYAGSENGNGCYCGNSIPSVAVRQTSDLCSTACPANSAQKCGAWNYISIYEAGGALTTPSSSMSSNLTSSTVSSKVSSSTSNSTSSTSSASSAANTTAVLTANRVAATPSASSNATSSVSKPSASSTSSISRNATASMSSSSIKPSSSSIAKTSAVASSTSSSVSTSKPSVSSTSVLPSNSSSSVSKTSAVSTASSSSAAATSSIIASSSTSKSTSSSVSQTQSSSAAVPSASGFVSLGCYMDSSARLLSGNSTESNTLTPSSCVAFCKGLGFQYAGSEHSTQCFCGNTLNKPAKLADSSCNKACAGASTLPCGGTWAVNVYNITLQA